MSTDTWTAYGPGSDRTPSTSVPDPTGVVEGVPRSGGSEDHEEKDQTFYPISDSGSVVATTLPGYLTTTQAGFVSRTV